MASSGGRKAIRSGLVNLLVTDLNKNVVFGEPMPNASYEVVLQPKANVSVSFWPSAYTASGFTINVSVGVAASFSYVATEL